MTEISKSSIEHLARRNIFAADGMRRAAGMLRDRVVGAFLGDLAAGFTQQAKELTRLMEGDAVPRPSGNGRGNVWREVESAFGSGDVSILTNVARALEELEEAYGFARTECRGGELGELVERHGISAGCTRRRITSLRDTLDARVANYPRRGATT